MQVNPKSVHAGERVSVFGSGRMPARQHRDADLARLPGALRRRQLGVSRRVRVLAPL
jgi:hypothetical protein